MKQVELEQIIALRHWLHAHPELSRTEDKTSEYLQGFLRDHAMPDEIFPLDGAGFAAIYNGVVPGKTVLIRTELDALPIHEVNNDMSYRSLYSGVGHKCGHDGHMAILTGLASVVATHRPASGRVVLLYQPDEETGSGARGCCVHDNFAKIVPDMAFALHNLPGFPTGQIVCRTGAFSSAVKYAAIRLSGKEAHSAQPETGVSPSFALAQITLMAQEVQRRFGTPDAYALVVPVYSQVGVQASGVCPGSGEAHFTLRSESGEVLDAMWQAFSERAVEIAINHRLEIEFRVIEDYTATDNDAGAVGMISAAAHKLDLEYVTVEHSFRWGEDFGEVTCRYPGAMFGLGAGLDCPALHNPDYDFPDELIQPGVEMFKTLVDLALGTTEGERVSASSK
ncbi:amidohydrolase [Roseovarius sp. EL26]|uniref:amidohydrolase n=1 Tax=Roseovarius sp. EL26 TaxID=2126672 RepID=UPI0013C46942|nr:amidohydrolase [Roseovarius sp. EL26]